MTGDAVWYEAAQVVGITNALNVAADGLGALGPVDLAAAPPEVRALLDEIRAFYDGGEAPPGFLLIAHDLDLTRFRGHCRSHESAVGVIHGQAQAAGIHGRVQG